ESEWKLPRRFLRAALRLLEAELCDWEPACLPRLLNDWSSSTKGSSQEALPCIFLRCSGVGMNT
ncbi:hypothetical protein Ciccas_007079, partial [Cichlidogyrus casuarinus]